MRYSLMQNALLAIEKCIFAAYFSDQNVLLYYKTLQFSQAVYSSLEASGVANSNQIFILVFSVPCDSVYIPGYRWADGLMNVQKDGEVLEHFYKSLH